MFMTTSTANAQALLVTCLGTHMGNYNKTGIQYSYQMHKLGKEAAWPAVLQQRRL